MEFYIIVFIMWLSLGVFTLIDKPYEKKQNEWRLQYGICWIVLMMFLLERIIG